MRNSPLTPAALRGLLDMAPGGVGCFDSTSTVVYANTAFTMTTGLLAGRRVEDERLLAELRGLGAAPARGCGGSPSGCRSRARCSGSTPS